MRTSNLFAGNHRTPQLATRRKLAASLRILTLVGFVGPILGCTLATTSTGPKRPITIDDDVAWMTQLAVPEPDIKAFYYNYSPAQQATLRNQVITARMYIADMEYHTYEAQLTRELQDEGLLATLVSLGLTGTASVTSVAQTGRVLSAIATGVTGADKAINEKELLNNTIQALQTQMRRDRKEEAAVIYSRMFADNSQTPTSIDRYPLPMALSDVDHYYQAGTLASALIGLSKTVAKAEQNADEAKAEAGPNSDKVTKTKRIANPGASDRITVVIPPAQRLTTSTQPVVKFGPVDDPITTALSKVEKDTVTPADATNFIAALCVKSPSATDDLGGLNSAQRLAIAKFKLGLKVPSRQSAPQDAEVQDQQSLQTIRTTGELANLRRAVKVAATQDQSSRCSAADAAFRLGQKLKSGGG